MKELIDFISKESSQETSEAVQLLSHAIRKRGNVLAILFYGSGLWKEAEEDTVYDFYVLVERYQDFDSSKLLALLGSIIPPNVYYMAIQAGQRELRCKFAVISIDQFARAANGHVFTPQIWTRFAQPCRIVYAQDENVRQKVNGMLACCVLSFHRCALPFTDENATPKEIWLRGLQETFASELRSERSDRVEKIFSANEAAFIQRSSLSQPLLTDIKRNSCKAKFAAKLKRPFQKIVVFVRLAKATLTFENGVDYVLWKIERQSGVRIEASDYQRRYPLIFAWPLVWKLWRKGAFS